MRPAFAQRGAALLALLYFLLALHGLGASDIVGDDEAREAGIVQDVVAGHWLLPRFNGELLPDKPLLYHWTAAVPCALAGFSETAVRLPSALAGAGLVWWTARFGAALLGARAGLVAAGLLATMPALFGHARVARPDVLLVLLLSASLGAAFRWWRDDRPREATLALVLLGAATLAKGPVGPALFALAFAGFLAWQRQLARLRRFPTAAGVGAFLVLGLGWYAGALAGWGDLFVREHLVGRYARNLVGGLAQGAPYSPRPLSFHLLFYPKHLLAIALPWTPVVALTLWQAWRTGGLRDPRLRFLVCWALAPVVAFTPAEWKLRYYLLPSLPPLALIAGPAVVQLWETAPRRPSLRTLGATTAALALVAGAALLAARSGSLALSDQRTLDVLSAAGPRAARAAAATVGFALGAALVALACRAWGWLAATAAAAVLVWMAAGQPALERATSARESLRPFAEAVGARYPEPAPLAFHPEAIRTVAVYAGRWIPTLARQRDLRGHVVIAPEDAYRSLAAAGVLGPPLATADGRIGNLRRGEVVLADAPAR